MWTEKLIASTYDWNPLTNGNIDDSPVDCFLMYLKHTRLYGMENISIIKSFPIHFALYSTCTGGYALTYDPVKIWRIDATIALTETMSNQVSVDICLFYSPIRYET